MRVRSWGFETGFFRSDTNPFITVATSEEPKAETKSKMMQVAMLKERCLS